MRVLLACCDGYGERVPSHGVALSLLRAFGRAIAPGCVSATRAEHVISAFSGSEEPALVLDSSDVCEAGIESTVVSFMGSGRGCVLRLEACLGLAEVGRKFPMEYCCVCMSISILWNFEQNLRLFANPCHLSMTIKRFVKKKTILCATRF